MSNATAIGAVAGSIFLINLPFGYWRAGVRKFSRQWFLAVHIPVPVAVGLRLLLHLGWRMGLLPLWIGVFFAGQFLGGKCRAVSANREPQIMNKKKEKQRSSSGKPFRLDKKVLTIAQGSNPPDDRAYWHSRTPEERMQAVEFLRQMNYGYDPTADRLQRVLEVIQRSSS